MRWHDTFIKVKKFNPSDWALPFDSMFKDFQGKFQTLWLGPYEINTNFYNGVVRIRNIDEQGITFLVDGNKLKLYHNSLKKEEFVRHL